MTRRRGVFTSFALLISGGVVLGFSTETLPDPSTLDVISVDPQRAVFDAVTTGDVVRGEFEVLNSTSGPVAISSLSSSCGCTAVADLRLPRVIRPGERIPVTYEFDSTGYRDQAIQSIIIHAVDESRNALDVAHFVTANVKPLVVATPGSLSFSEPGSRVNVKVSSPARTDLAGFGVVPTRSWIRTAISSGSSFDVWVSGLPLTESDLHGEVVVRTGWMKDPELRIPVVYDTAATR